METLSTQLGKLTTFTWTCCFKALTTLMRCFFKDKSSTCVCSGGRAVGWWHVDSKLWMNECGADNDAVYNVSVYGPSLDLLFYWWNWFVSVEEKKHVSRLFFIFYCPFSNKLCKTGMRKLDVVHRLFTYETFKFNLLVEKIKYRYTAVLLCEHFMWIFFSTTGKTELLTIL